MKSKKVHPVSGDNNNNNNDGVDSSSRQDQKWFRYDEGTDDVAIDLESLDRAKKGQKKTKFDIFLAKIKDEPLGVESEDGSDLDAEEDDELLLKTYVFTYF